MRYTTFALQRRIYPKVTNWKFADLETGLTIAGVGFFQWKAGHHVGGKEPYPTETIGPRMLGPRILKA